MIRLTIAAIGKIKEKYLRDGIAEYTKRLTPFVKLEVTEGREETFSPDMAAAQKQQLLTKEGQKLLSLVPKESYTIALDVGGKMFSSPEMARKIAEIADSGQSITFLIGGPLGLSDEVRAAVKERWSFSPLTFTHQMVRLILFEQIYRAIKINRGEKYHW